MKRPYLIERVTVRVVCWLILTGICAVWWIGFLTVLQSFM